MKRADLIECASSSSAEVGTDLMDAITAYGEQPCLLCGASPVYTGLFDPTPGSHGRALMLAKFGSPQPGKSRLLVYFLCGSHEPSREVAQAVERVVFDDVLKQAHA